MKTTHNLFICADVGARSGFVGAWLNKKLLPDCFDVGREVGVFFHKEHFDLDNKKVKSFNGRKIRIQPDLPLLATHMTLSLEKDVYIKIPEFKFPRKSYEVFEKMFYSGKLWFSHDSQIDPGLYDKIISFSDTYNLTKMIELYMWYNNGSFPTSCEIEHFNSTNKKNLPILEKKRLL